MPDPAFAELRTMAVACGALPPEGMRLLTVQEQQEIDQSKKHHLPKTAAQLEQERQAKQRRERIKNRERMAKESRRRNRRRR